MGCTTNGTQACRVNSRRETGHLMALMPLTIVQCNGHLRRIGRLCPINGLHPVRINREGMRIIRIFDRPLLALIALVRTRAMFRPIIKPDLILKCVIIARGHIHLNGVQLKGCVVVPAENLTTSPRLAGQAGVNPYRTRRLFCLTGRTGILRGVFR